MSEVKLKYLEASDEEVEEKLLAQLREMKQLLKEIRDLLREAGGWESGE